LKLEHADDVSPLTLRGFATAAVPFQFSQDRRLWRVDIHSRAVVDVELDLSPASQPLAIEDVLGGDKYVHLHGGSEMNNVEGLTALDGRAHGVFIDVTCFAQQTGERNDIRRSEVGNEIDVVGRTRLSVERARERSADYIRNSDPVERRRDEERDFNGIGESLRCHLAIHHTPGERGRRQSAVVPSVRAVARPARPGVAL